MNGKVRIDSSEGEDEIEHIFDGYPMQKKTLLLESPIAQLYLSPIISSLSEIGIFDFDPKLPKKTAPITGVTELASDGANLALVLNRISTDGESKRAFLNLMRYMLPFVHRMDVSKVADKSMYFTLRETYARNFELPASLLSDGTVNITALIVALYFEKNKLVVIEEPERNVHPALMSKTVEMMKEAAQKKQIIATTHNPELIRHVDLEDILLVCRDESGRSVVIRPAQSEDVQTFLENDFQISDLFVDNLLEV
ncbi:MAG: hypothetical protein BZY79_04925 [SAR202 cluster bacterium Casp-Chloro-G4]|nr:MAG: hypothetical protein BZY79_04925 [SAR202 cluster bacterium Casp-Chloro-G4]